MVSPIKDNVLGELQWNAELGKFQSSVDIKGASLTFQVEPYDRNSPDFTSSREHLNRIRSDATSFKSAVAKRMLKTHNESVFKASRGADLKFC